MPLPRITDLVTLQDSHVRLEPLRADHAPALAEAAADGELHKLWYTAIPEPDRVVAEIDRRLALHATGSPQRLARIGARMGAVGRVLSARARRLATADASAGTSPESCGLRIN